MATEVLELDTAQLDEVIKADKALVIFYSKTCGPCKMLRFVLKDIAKGVDGVSIGEIDFDANKDATAKYKVESYPTLLLFKKGEEVKRVKGLQQKPKVLQMINEG